MACFDVHRLRASRATLVVDVQTDVLAHLGSRVVVPLTPLRLTEREVFRILKPQVEVAGEPYVFLPTDIATVLVSELGDVVANIETASRDAITRALDFLFQGN